MPDPNKKSAASLPSLYVLQFESVARRGEIMEELEYAGWVGEVIKNFKTQGTGRLYVAVIVGDQGEPTHLCRLLRRGGVGLDRIAIGLSEVEALHVREAETVKAAILRGASKKRKEKTFADFGRLMPDEIRAVMTTLEQVDEALANKLREKGLADDRMLKGYSEHAKEIVSLERDSLGLALEIAFGEREGLVVDGLPPKLPGSFLEMLGMTKLIEDEMIVFDKGRFPGMEQVAGETPRVKKFEHNGSTLEVIHANRNDLEHTLGVDLIYVSHYFNSFVGVQYKMLEGEKQNARFTPNKKFHSQLEKMNSIIGKLSPPRPVKEHRDYRLHSGPFFFKFVARLETNFANDALCPGLYLPSDLVERIVQDADAKIGETDGTRHLSNSEFTSLFRQGWIGTHGSHTAAIRDLIADAVQGKRSLVIAVDRRATPKERGRRKKQLARR
jgi:hypothetical protein